jgi:hypothetical protein
VSANPKPEALFAYGMFCNVRLTPVELQRLYERFGIDTARAWIETLSEGKAAHGYKYKSDYAAILVWSRREDKKKCLKEPVMPLCCQPHSGMSDEEFKHFMGED